MKAYLSLLRGSWTHLSPAPWGEDLGSDPFVTGCVLLGVVVVIFLAACSI